MSSPRPRRRCYTDSGIRSLPDELKRKQIASVIANLLLWAIGLWLLLPLLGWRGCIGAWIFMAGFRGRRNSN
jgi:hypothetical protein